MKDKNLNNRSAWSDLAIGTPIDITFKPLTDPVWHKACDEGGHVIHDADNDALYSGITYEIVVGHTLRMRVIDEVDDGQWRLQCRDSAGETLVVTEDYVAWFEVTGPQLVAGSMELLALDDDGDESSFLEVKFKIDGSVVFDDEANDACHVATRASLVELRDRLIAHLAQ